MLDMMAARLSSGMPHVTFKPAGTSMQPLIQSGEQVTVHRLTDPGRVELKPGDVVLARVAGSVYLHKVTAVDHDRRRVQIGNNRGRVNGWTGYAKVYGICPRPDAPPAPVRLSIPPLPAPRREYRRAG